ncbi:MAG: alpha/beta hydrolase [Propionibacteriaceae bacterium]|nr:alpha/beta hydrolase [Propionibacteriaceae bacterium]
MDTPLLIFLHGPGQSPPAWQEVVGAINPDQAMVAPWLKGLKPTEHSGFDIDQAVEAVFDVMEARGATRADLVGYSLGGLVAARVAIAHPDRIGHLVLIATPLIPDRATLNRQRRLVKLTPAGLFRGVDKEHILTALDALALAGLGIDPAAIRTPLLAIASEDDPASRQSAEEFARLANATTRYLPSTGDLLKTHGPQLAQLISDFCADFLDPK